MKNISAVFSEFSILNWRFLLKLASKYLWISCTIPVIVTIVSAYFYLRQHDIYMSQIAFRNVAAFDNSPTQQIATLLGEKTDRISANEIIGMAKSVDFLQRVSEKIVKDPDFASMSFTSIYEANKKNTKQMFLECLDTECAIGRVRGVISNFFTIVGDDSVSNRFIATVKTLDENTTQKIIRAMSEAFVEYRSETIAHSLSEQRKISEELIKDRRESLQKLDIMEKNREMAQAKMQMEGLEKKLSLYQLSLEEKRMEFSQIEISSKITNKTINKDIDKKLKADWERYQKLKIKKDLISADLVALEGTALTESEDDKKIVKDLNDNLKKINAEIAELEKSKIAANFETFKADKEKSKDYVEFQGKVLGDQIKELEQNVKDIEGDRTALLSKVKEISSELEEHQPSLEYLKLLEQKMLQLKLVEGTVVSDIVFDNYLLGKRHYKRHKLSATIAFSLFVSIFLVILGILLRYLFDERIVDKEDFKNNFRDIEILGEVPEL